MTTKTQKTTIALLTLILGTSAIVMNIPDALAVSFPDVRSDWESHDADYGTKTTIAYKNPSITNPASDYWWAKTFTSWGAYSVNTSQGAVGAGTAKYNPIGGGSTEYKAIVWYWDVDANSQGYEFGNTISGSETVSVRNTSGSTWERISDNIDSDKTISGLTWGHSKVGMLQSYATNNMDGSFTSNQLYDGGWQNLSTTSQAGYCEPTTDDPTDKEVDLVSGSINNLKFGSSASANDCTASHTPSDTIPG